MHATVQPWHAEGRPSPTEALRCLQCLAACSTSWPSTWIRTTRADWRPGAALGCGHFCSNLYSACA